ncbi:MAG TPA: GNAT family N-acetyltransferase [Pirellulales bacterium]|nr:GNAT family N-acetyltransferase [Pirellulales bacterium]
MRTVLHLVRALEVRPVWPRVAGISLRNFDGPRDIDGWLDIRRCAFGDEGLPIRDWTAHDFAAEMMSKPWWSPKHLWFAEAVRPDAEGARAIGAVALAMRRGERAVRDRTQAGMTEGRGVPVVHWLMVVPQWRRRGVARWLLAALETACWDAGYRQVALETHAAWTAAAAFYRSMGYV